MIRLYAVVEDQTEEAFFNQVLAPHLGAYRVMAMHPQLVRTGRHRGRNLRGGFLRFAKLKSDIDLLMNSDRRPDARFTTMLDLYALPGDFPDRARALAEPDPYKRVAILEDAMSQSIGSSRLTPYLQLHEFEALLLTKPEALKADFPERAGAINRLATSLAGHSPELVDDGPETSPSKRIIAGVPEYEGRKVTAGPRIAGLIGLATLRARAPHFGAWLTQLENLA